MSIIKLSYIAYPQKSLENMKLSLSYELPTPQSHQEKTKPEIVGRSTFAVADETALQCQSHSLMEPEKRIQITIQLTDTEIHKLHVTHGHACTRIVFIISVLKQYSLIYTTEKAYMIYMYMYK